MLRDITIGQHFPGNSILHTMDPRVKLLLTIAYIVMLFVGSNWRDSLFPSCSSLFCTLWRRYRSKSWEKASSRSCPSFCLRPC